VRSPSLPLRGPGGGAALPVWEAVAQTRRAERLGVRDLLRYGARGTLALNGTEEGEQDAAVLVTLTRLDGQPCVLIGQDRQQQTRATPLGAAALRQARRGMRLAEELGLPLVTVIDTPGAELSREAEEGAIAGEIARCIATLTTMTVPTVSLILGQACGGGALALLPAQVVVATENAWLSPLPPEGASVIRFGDTEHAAEMAESQGIGSAALVESGIVHRVVPELPEDGAEALAATVANPGEAVARVGRRSRTANLGGPGTSSFPQATGRSGGDLALALQQRLTQVPDGALETAPQRCPHIGCCRGSVVELPAGLGPAAAEPVHQLTRPVVAFHGAEVDLDLEVFDATLPLVALGLGELLEELGLLGIELVELGFQLGNALFTSHVPTVSSADVRPVGPKGPSDRPIGHPSTVTLGSPPSSAPVVPLPLA
jgi:acetyl-CoA carboxylase alpha subunit